MAANDVPCCEPKFWIYLMTSVALVCFAGLMSGLTLGLMSLSLVDLEVLVKAGQPEDRKNAAKILPIVKKQHLLLCTLLIYNAMAMEALPIFLDSILPAWLAILISVTLILAFGEIIPQAVCSRYGLSVGAKLSVLVRLLVIVLWPISYPISKFLDWLLGKGHSALLGRSELKTFVDLHGNEAGKGGELTHHETTIIGGALDLTLKTAKDAMTPTSEVFSLDINTKLDKDTLEVIMRKGHSRVPIYSGSPTNIIGLILVKNLIICRPEDETPIRNLTIRKIPRFCDNLPLYDILNQFQKGNSHMGVVVKSKQDFRDMAEITSLPASQDVKVDLNSMTEQAKRNGMNHDPLRKGQQNTLRNASAVHCCGAKARSPLSNVMERGKDSPLYPQYGDFLEAHLDSFSYVNDEVIGIITMEDVIEELLQEEILDETDVYIDVHSKISINMTPGRISSPRSSGAARVAHRNTPILQSPLSPYIPSPLVRPTLLSSPVRSVRSSPTIAGPMQSSPSSQHRCKVLSHH
ncbi:hypothetical protein Ancab_009176 [Ancistrocladus abbreviatus]